MTNLVEYALAILVVYCVTDLSSSSESDVGLTAGSSKTDRAGHKYYDAEIYTGNYHDGVPFGEDGFRPIPRSVTGKKQVIAYRHAGNGIMKKTGNNLNWNVWKGDDDGSMDDDESGGNDSPKWQQPPPPPSPPQMWNTNNNDAWVTDPMYIMMLKNAMADMKGETKPSGFLSKLTSEPAFLLIAASIPISLLLAAVLPAIMNFMANGSHIPTVTTTATGSKARGTQVDIMPYLNPVMEAIGTFGVRSIGDPNCMQKIFCQVAQEKMAPQGSKYLKKAARVARYVSVGSWLENLGVKEIIDALGSGTCENIPCTHSSKKKEDHKSRYSQKLHLNSVKK